MLCRQLIWASAISVLLAGFARAEVLFEDDFEARRIDDEKWVPTPGWEIVENKDYKTNDHDILEQRVLDVWGGHWGLSVPDFPEDYDYYADFMVIIPGGIPTNPPNGVGQFIFHAKNIDNLYLHQYDVSGPTPQHMRWHRIVAAGSTLDPTPFENAYPLEPDVWYRAKFEVRGPMFTAYIGDVGETDSKKFVRLAEWIDPLEAWKKGKIGFRQWGPARKIGAPEQAQYDNVIVVTPGISLAVSPQLKLTLTWGSLRTQL